MNFDVVVVGGGGSGLAAAIEAATSGAAVVCLEKNPTCGGTTARSIGSISASRTRHQARAGIVDTPELHYNDIPLFAKHIPRGDNDALRRVLAEKVPETFDWLCKLGVEFFGPLEEPPNSKPRMHNVLPNSRAYIYHLEREARRRGVRILTSARALRLVSDAGRVVGVEVERPGAGTQVIHGPRGIVLAAGDYAADPDMKLRYIGEAAARTTPINPTSTGDGIRLGLAAGGHIINGDLFGGGIRFSPPLEPSWISRLPPSPWIMRPTNFLLQHAPLALVRRFVMGFLTTVLVPALEMFEEGAILVNANGERFADETRRMLWELADQPDGLAYLVLDAAVANKFRQWPHYVSTAPGFAYAYLQDYERNRPDLITKAATLEELAAAIKADPARLAATVQEYNSNAVGEGRSLPGRGHRPALGGGPYYALGPVRNYINYTDGGLSVNEHLQVLTADGKPIPGLFAAGSNGQGGLLLKGHGHHLGWAFTSGRIAGRNAAEGVSA
jgi:succinate dehydrogenase/fumarate reductase flavoprotein subunit